MRKKVNLLKLNRRPKMRYVFSAASTPNYMYCVKSRMNGSEMYKTPNRVIYNVNNIPKWVWEGMQLIDLAVTPETNTAHIPNFGGKFKEKYYFYEDGVYDEPLNLS